MRAGRSRRRGGQGGAINVQPAACGLILKQGTVVDATIFAMRSVTKDRDGALMGSACP